MAKPNLLQAHAGQEIDLLRCTGPHAHFLNYHLFHNLGLFIYLGNFSIPNLMLFISCFALQFKLLINTSVSPFLACLPVFSLRKQNQTLQILSFPASSYNDVGHTCFCVQLYFAHFHCFMVFNLWVFCNFKSLILFTVTCHVLLLSFCQV